MRRILVSLLTLSLCLPLLVGCKAGNSSSGKKTSDIESHPVYVSEFPVGRSASDGFDHAVFDAAVMGLVLNNVTENQLISLSSLYFALSSVTPIAGGSTKSQLLSFLGASDEKQLQENIQTLWKSQFYHTQNTTSLIGHSLWINADAVLDENVLAPLTDNYYTSTYIGKPTNAAFVQAYRDWINSMTGDLLADQAAQSGPDSDMVMQSVSTIYFRSAWEEPFLEEATHQETFRTSSKNISVQMMHKTSTYPYHKNEKFEAAGLPLSDGAVLWLVLPSGGLTPSELVTDSRFTTWLNGPTSEQTAIQISLPKFDIKSDIKWKELLPSAGLKDLFDPNLADFPGFDGLYVSRIDQMARLQIDEAGIQAAAATEVMMTSAADPPETLQFRLNRPFFFALRDSDGTLLFAGIVNDPTR